MKKVYLSSLLITITLITTHSLHAQNWLLTGNSGISATNFLGTKDAHDLIFKTNNAEGGRLLSTGTWRFTAPLQINKTSQPELLRLQSASPYVSFYDSTGKYQGFVWKNTTNDMIFGTSCSNATGRVILQLNCADNYVFTRTGSFTISGSAPQIYFKQNGANSGNMYGSGTNLFINGATASSLSATPGNLILQTGSTSQFGNAFAGNVGIGTTAPATKLEVQTGDNSWGIIHTNGSVKAGMYVGSSGGWVATKSNSPLYFATSLLNTNNIAQMTLLTNGNFGIGTLAPATKLEVKTGDNSWGIIHTNGSVRAGMYVGSSGGWVATSSNSPLYFATSLLNTNSIAQMTLLPNGNLGIGTLNPTYKLSVNGAIRAKEVRVETGWADYVFEKDYKLPSLKEVEDFIMKNKHLPDVTPGPQIENNGLEVGKVASQMIKKIEELTLYVIELQKQVDALKSNYNKTDVY